MLTAQPLPDTCMPVTLLSAISTGSAKATVIPPVHSAGLWKFSGRHARRTLYQLCDPVFRPASVGSAV